MIRLRLLFLALLAVLAVAPRAHAVDANLHWSAVTGGCTGPLTAPIAGYRVYWGTVGRVAAGLPQSSTGPCNDPTQVAATNPKRVVAYPNTAVVINNPAVLTTVIALPNDAKRYFFSMTAFDSTGAESNLTNEVSKLADVPPTAPQFTVATCPTCSIIPNVTLVNGITGKPITINWLAQATPVVVSVLEYPQKVGGLPIVQATLAPAVVKWDWVPGRQGMFYTRICAGTLCTDGHTQGLLYSIKLAPPTGGGIN